MEAGHRRPIIEPKVLNMDIRSKIIRMGQEAREASRILARTPTDLKNRALGHGG